MTNLIDTTSPDQHSTNSRMIHGEEIAIVGISCRFPGARNLQEFWSNLLAGKQSISFLAGNEVSAVSNPELTGHPHYVPCKGGVLDDIDQFDAPFFRYAPREAELMDPQMRIFHECTWNALEDAGYVPALYKGRIGLYAGASDNTHWKNHVLFSDPGQTRDNFALSQLIDKDHIFTKVAYALNLTGPCYALQTACSTSLVAIHVAGQALLNGECDMALAGGVSLHYGFDQGYIYQDGSILSPDGHCRAFDARAKGTILGSGVAVVVLKLLEHAIRDRDSVYAVIKGSAINNDGNHKVGYTSPSVSGQAKVIRHALRISEVAPASVCYIEGHGTGTPLGDPIEIEALKEVYGKSDTKFCGIGSVKTNIGHLDVAAGIAGLIKTALILKTRKIPPTANFSSINPRIDLKGSPFFIADKQIDLPEQTTLRAGVSSFGIGGTNAHVILESFEDNIQKMSDTRPGLFVLSAKTGSSLEAHKRELRGYLDRSKEPLRDIAYTLAVGREKFQVREAFVAATTDELKQKLGETSVPKAVNDRNGPPEIILMFSGQGAQYAGMCSALYENEPLIKAHLDKGLDAYHALTGNDLRNLLVDDLTADHSAANALLQQTINAQPALFILEHALAQYLIELGIKPVDMIGHSIGEYVAACLAGVFSFEDGLRIVVKRAELMQQMAPGSMLSVTADAKELLSVLKEPVTVAAINAPGSCVLSGSTEALKRLAVELKAAGYASTLLKTSHAFHSAMMEPMLEEFRYFMNAIDFRSPVHAFISNLTGTHIEPGQAVSPAYWTDHLRHTVQFSKGMDLLCASYPNGVFVEVGPGNVLASFMRKSKASTPSHIAIPFVKPPTEKENAHVYFLRATGKLWENSDMDLDRIYARQPYRRVHLPGYAFDDHRFNATVSWRSVKELLAQQTDAPKGDSEAVAFYTPYWEQAVEYQYRSPETSQNNWLIFYRDPLQQATLLKMLEPSSARVVLVTEGHGFAEIQPFVFTINPAVGEDYRRLLRCLAERELLPDFVVHAWGLNTSPGDMLSFQNIERCFAMGFNTLTGLVQGYGAQGITKPTTIAVVTNESLSVSGTDCHHPENAMLAGLAKIISVEYPNIQCRQFDIAIKELLDSPEHLLKRLFTQITLPHKHVSVALRAGLVWVQNFRSLQADAFPPAHISLLKPEGVYLITGGGGGMALHIAKFLVEEYRATVILVGRRNLNMPDGAVAQDVLKYQMADALVKGGRAVFYQADVGDRVQMAAIVDECWQNYGKINGVFHTAATIDTFGVIQKRKQEDFRVSMHAKVQGTAVLCQVLKKMPPDFVVLFSSGGTITYGEKYGESGYVASNEFLDALAGSLCIHPETVIKTINWCDWSQVGMSVKSIDNFYQDDTASKQTALSLFEKEALTPQQGIAVLAAIMTNTMPRIAVSRHSLNNIHLSAVNGRDKKRDLFLEKRQQKRLQPARQPSGEAHIAPGDQVQQQIAAVWQEYFGYSNISIYDNIFELGANSLDLAQINTMFKVRLNVDIPLVTLFEYPTIDKLSQYLKGSTAPADNDFAGRIQDGKSKMNKMRTLAK